MAAKSVKCTTGMKRREAKSFEREKMFIDFRSCPSNFDQPPLPATTFHSMDFQPVVVQRAPRPASSKHNAESRYWRQYKYPVFVKEYAPVTSIHFSPTKPHRFAVTAATRVQIYAPKTQKVTKTIARFKDVARSGSIRQDGKLVIAGDDSGLVQVSLNIFMTIFFQHVS
jgi:hypothetical protein